MNAEKEDAKKNVTYELFKRELFASFFHLLVVLILGILVLGCTQMSAEEIAKKVEER